jgi:hypothetical protein
VSVNEASWLIARQTRHQIHEKRFVEPEMHIHTVHASKVTRATTVELMAFSVMSGSHKDLASGGDCGVELQSYDWRHNACTRTASWEFVLGEQRPRCTVHVELSVAKNLSDCSRND